MLQEIEIIDILIVYLLISYVLIGLSFWFGWIRIGSHRSISYKKNKTVSIIIPARNEEKMIARCITSIANQTYPQDLIEIIIINDNSTDNTVNEINKLNIKNVKLIHLEENSKINSYKKKAIADAISIAKGEIIVTTDADCWMGQKWIETIMQYYHNTDVKMISSPVSYSEEKSFFEKIQSLEFLYLISLGASSIANKTGGSCNGANLSYRKEAFYEVDGFKGIDNLASGDDELLLHKIQAKFENKVLFLKSKDAIVYTIAKPNISEFISQRKRWASKSTKYKDKKIIVLGVMVYLYCLAFVSIAFMSLFYSAMIQYFLMLLVAKFIIDIIWILPVLSFFKRVSLLKYFIPLFVIHPFYILYIGVAGQSKQYEWKGRKVS